MGKILEAFNSFKREAERPQREAVRRKAWIAFAANCNREEIWTAHDIADFADALLAEFDKRFFPEGGE